jgi:hypothetical protein
MDNFSHQKKWPWWKMDQRTVKPRDKGGDVFAVLFLAPVFCDLQQHAYFSLTRGRYSPTLKWRWEEAILSGNPAVHLNSCPSRL